MKLPGLRNRWLAVSAVTALLAVSALAAAGEVPPSGGRQSAATKVTCAIRQYNGKPTLFVNGAPQFPMAFASYFPQPFRYKQFGDQGIHVHFLCLPLSDKWISWTVRRVRNHMPGIWKGPDELDFGAVDQKIGEILANDPQAHIVLRVYCESPIWWDARHGEDVRTVGQSVPLRQSFSSAAWINDTTAVLKRLVSYISSAPYGDRVIGYMPTAGDTEEVADTVADLSPCAQRAFREWIVRKYGNDHSAISRLFGCTAERIGIPPVARRHTPEVPIPGLTAGDCGNFLDPQKSRLVIDYRQFESEKMADMAIALCRAVKEASQGRLLTGAFYGYTRIFPDTGHLAFRRLLESGVVDFISTPYSSGGRKYHLSVGYSDFQNPTEVASLQKAGRLFYAETDTRTSVGRWISDTRPEIDPERHYVQEGWLGPPTIPDTLQVLKMVFARILISGSANWWFDLWGGWYDDPEIMKLFGRMQTVGRQSLERPRGSVAQMAVFLDEKSYLYLPFSVSEHGGRFAWVSGQLGQFGRVGAPYDVYLLDELKDLDLRRYRMLVFLNAFVLSQEQRSIIQRRAMADNRLLLWLYAPGLIKDDRLSVDHVSSLVGMKCQMDSSQAAAKVTLKLAGEPLVYQGAAVAPFLHVRGGADRAVGHTAAGEVVVAEKAGANCRNVLVSVPPLPWTALQHYAREAKVHLYTEGGDVVLANESYLALAAGTAGKRRLRLPAKAALGELLPLGKGENLPAGTEFEVEMGANRCRLFEVLPHRSSE